MSIEASLSPSLHYKIGQALAPLRKEDVLIVCSGQATHNMRIRTNDLDGKPPAAWATSFVEWLEEVAYDPTKHTAAVAEQWRDAAGAKQAHPREDHLVPFFVALGASMGQPGKTVIDGWFFQHFSLKSFMWS
jgi:4,5-DOPA dioxygenase extradiol